VNIQATNNLWRPVQVCGDDTYEFLGEYTSMYQALHYGPPDTSTILQIYPTSLPNYWQLAAFFAGSISYTKRPMWREALAIWFNLLQVDVSTYKWSSKLYAPVARNPYDIDAPIVSRTSPTQGKPHTYVYFIQAYADGLIKIGFSNDPYKRLAILQCGSPVPLRLIATIAADISLESALHKKFKHLRQHGEWFYPAIELLEYIEKEAESA